MSLYKNSLICLFLFLALVAGCDRTGGSVDPQTEELKNIPVELCASSSISVKTKASVNSWEDNEIYVFGLRRNEDGVYDFDDPYDIVNWPGVVASDGSVALYASEYVDDTGNLVRKPFFYQEGYAYDFFGYHLGGAEVVSSEEGRLQYKVHVRFFGNNDLMYAYTIREDDVLKVKENISTSMLYSASSARRGVRPTLNFYHALSRFIFIPEGSGDGQEDVVLEGLSMKSVDSGTLTLMDGEAAFVPADGAEMVDFVLKDADDTAYTPEDLVSIPDKTPMGGEGASLMLAPGMNQVEITLYLKSKIAGKVYEHSFVVKASDFPSGHSNFRAGYSYTIRMIVYRLQEIEIEAGLEEWIYEDYEFDPDNPNNNTPVTGEHPMGDNFVNVGDYVYGGDLGEIVD